MLSEESLRRKCFNMWMIKKKSHNCLSLTPQNFQASLDDTSMAQTNPLLLRGEEGICYWKTCT